MEACIAIYYFKKKQRSDYCIIPYLRLPQQNISQTDSFELFASLFNQFYTDSDGEQNQMRTYGNRVEHASECVHVSLVALKYYPAR